MQRNAVMPGIVRTLLNECFGLRVSVSQTDPVFVEGAADPAVGFAPYVESTVIWFGHAAHAQHHVELLHPDHASGL